MPVKCKEIVNLTTLVPRAAEALAEAQRVNSDRKDLAHKKPAPRKGGIIICAIEFYGQ